MNLANSSYRGKPLVALALLIGGWVTMRVILWDATPPRSAAPVPIAFADRGERALPAAGAGAAARAASAPEAPRAARRDESALDPLPAARRVPRPSEPIAPAMRYYLAPPPAPPAGTLPVHPAPRVLVRPQEPIRRGVSDLERVPGQGPGQPSGRGPVPVRVSAAHQLLWMAAVAGLPMPSSLQASFQAAPGAPTRPVPARPEPVTIASGRRWSGDVWFLGRRGGSVPAGGFAPPTYGASQAGAVLRYRLAPGSAHRPTLYLRGSAALNGAREREAALGLAVRPVAALPIAVAAEGRINHQPAGARLRPAAFAYTEFAPLDLPLAARAEFYAQAGYVGGNFASAFADGQLRVDRRVARIGRAELRAGAGAWGGAQRGAARLDLGPGATLGFPVGDGIGARLAMDWRFRLAGNAAPASGPALTLSAGF